MTICFRLRPIGNKSPFCPHTVHEPLMDEDIYGIAYGNTAYVKNLAQLKLGR